MIVPIPVDIQLYVRSSMKNLIKLAQSDDVGIRIEVARHPNCSIDILRMLVVDESSVVRGWAVLNPAMTDELRILNKAFLLATYFNVIIKFKEL